MLLAGSSLKRQYAQLLEHDAYVEGLSRILFFDIDAIHRWENEGGACYGSSV